MSIIGITVGTPLSPSKIEDRIKPVKTVNGVAPDENGNVDVAGGSGCDVSVEGEKLFLSDGGNDGVYELIDTIILEEDAMLDIRQEPDGTSYKFKGVMAFVSLPENAPTFGSINFYYYSNTVAVGLSYVPGNTAVSESKKYASVECVDYYGHWLPKWRTSWNSTESGAGVNTFGNYRWRLYSTSDSPYITRIWTKANNFPAGTTIEIWGVRA